MKISELGFPEEFLNLVDGNDFDLYDHQREAIEKFRTGRNVMVSVPTASGKTLIAYAAIYEKFQLHQRSIYIVPLKALAMEKYEELRKLQELGLKVAISVGDYDSSPSFIKNYDVIVCTSEKADSMFHHDPSILFDIGLIIADEVHMIGDETRGPKLEMVLSSATFVNPDISILALSATISNSEEVSHWINADLVESDFRPVPLKYGVIHKRAIEYNDGSVEELTGRDELIEVAKKHIENGGQILLFVNSRKRAEDTARKLSIALKDTYSVDEEEFSELSGESDRYDNAIKDLAKYGVSFHHAGLSNEQRHFVEKLFKDRILKIIVATPTLAAGVNLPARVVIVRDLTRFSGGYSSYISNIEVQQMLGRAGRPKYDDHGYALLFASTENAYEKSLEYFYGEIEPLESNLGEMRLLRFNILALVSTGIATDIESIYNFYDKTLYGMQNNLSSMRPIFSETIEFLKTNDFIKEQFGVLKATSFGKMVSDLYIDPKSAIILKSYFEKTHSIDLALYHISLTPDIIPFSFRRDDLVNVEYFLDQNDIYDQDDDSYRAAKTAMVLREWIDEVPIQTITEKYSIGPGDVQARVSSADWISYSLARISSMFKPEIRRSLERLNIRIKEGVKEEVINITLIPNIGRVRGRRLYNAGYTNLELLSKAKIEDVTKIIGFSDKLARDTIDYSKRLVKKVVE